MSMQLDDVSGAVWFFWGLFVIFLTLTFILRRLSLRRRRQLYDYPPSVYRFRARRMYRVYATTLALSVVAAVATDVFWRFSL
ncbi:hypothetical protein [Paraburkholderia flagellata]|uniref:hypothetical protein n=1 Tax=Paraburkholderia flagellata TaxID=2883241 RepID=UPI001F221771|nr:hypothetical protein [Paraburkholderia flagellata]